MTNATIQNQIKRRLSGEKIEFCFLNDCAIANNATSANTPEALVVRDANGSFSAGTVAATNFTGNGSGLTNIAAASITGALDNDLAAAARRAATSATTTPRANPAAWYWFEGNFEGYERNKVERLGLEAARPHRVTYRKLTRG